MDKVDDSVDDSEVLRDRRGKRMNLFIAIIVIILVSTFCASSYYYVNLSNRPVEVVEELGPWSYPFYDVEEQETLEAANAQLAAMEMGNIQTIDPDSGSYRARLYRNNNWGFIYWEFKQGETEIWVHAGTGEIIRYWSLVRGDDVRRHSDEHETTEFVMDLITQFAPPPEDMEPPYYRHSSWCSEDVLLPNGTWGFVDYFQDWHYQFNRSYNGVDTSDSIFVWLEVDGSLTSYRKEWFLDLEDFDTTSTVSAEEAESLAREFLTIEHGEPNETLEYCVKRITYPMSLDEGVLPRDTPVLIWSLEFTGPGPSCNTHWVGVSGTGEPEILYFWHCA